MHTQPNSHKNPEDEAFHLLLNFQILNLETRLIASFSTFTSTSVLFSSLAFYKAILDAKSSCFIPIP